MPTWNKKKELGLGLVSIGVAVALFFVLPQKDESKNSVHGPESAPQISPKNQIEGENRETIQPKKENENESDVRLFLPDQRNYLEQAKANVHQVPPVVFDFAKQTAAVMKLALKSPSQAEQVMAQFEDCALTPKEELAVSMRALCVVNAKRLLKQFSSLSRQADWIHKDLPEDLKTLVEVLEAS